jgi:hypothetical protein
MKLRDTVLGRSVALVAMMILSALPGICDAPIEAGRAEPEAIPPLETVGDPPATIGSAEGAVKTMAMTPVERHGFVSVQVNVDARGLNIPGDAANEPSIAVDPLDPRRMSIGWRQFDTVNSNFRQAGWGWSDDRGASWTFPGVFTPGNFRSDPVLDSDADGRFYYYSLRGSLLCDFFFSSDGGQNWTGPVAAYGGDKQWFTIDRTDGAGRGNIYVSWSTASNPWGERVFTRSTDGGQNFSSPIVLQPAPIWGTLTVDPDGGLYLVGNAAFNKSIFVLWRSLDAWDAAVDPTFDSFVVPLGGRQDSFGGPNPGGLVGQVWIAADHSDGPYGGDLYVASSVDPPGGDPQDVHFVRSTDRGETWSQPVRVNTDDRDAWQWFGTMSVSPGGRIDVVWIESLTNHQPNIGELTYAFSVDGGSTWSVPVAVSPTFDSWVGWPNQNKMGDYYDMVSDETGADLAYAATYNDEQDVFYLRLWADCNSNGVSDAYEMWSGRVRDCNENTVPDTCELIEDPGLDGDGDGVIDECQTAPRSGGIGRVVP